MKRYQELACQIEGLIESGVLKPRMRLPSVRQASRSYGISPSTVFQAYYALERRGLIVARPRSGYFVNCRQLADLRPAPILAHSAATQTSSLTHRFMQALQDCDNAALASPWPNPELFPLGRLARSLNRAARSMDCGENTVPMPMGEECLRRQIARRYLTVGMVVPIDEIIITSGALDALTLSLQTLTRPGDIVAIGHPTFYGALSAVERLHLKIVEIPVDPHEGLDLDVLADALGRHPIRVCWFMTSLQNPTGVTLPDDKKQALIELLAAHDVPLIEDDVYSELHFGSTPTHPAKRFDRTNLVLHCGSFSKCLAPRYRIGWVAAGRFAPWIARARLTAALSASVPAQLAIADYLEHGGYDRFLRKLRLDLARLQAQMLRAIRDYFPPGTSVVKPDGGYFLWVELPPHVDAVHLFEVAVAHGIAIAPGPIFSAAGDLRRYIRLNYGHPWTPAVEGAIRTIGALACRAVPPSGLPVTLQQIKR
jgi:DNA-binding transcriptional MocR family regulator